MSINYPWIILLYASHTDIVVETLAALQSGISANAIVNDHTPQPQRWLDSQRSSRN
ncbi:hypothetical protein RSAG8_04364, partial [Rhizoctonia solani AG-8 WAC10335]